MKIDDMDEINFGELAWAEDKNEMTWPTMEEGRGRWQQVQRMKKRKTTIKAEGVPDAPTQPEACQMKRGPRRTRGVSTQEIRILRGGDSTIYQPVGASLNALTLDLQDEDASTPFEPKLEELGRIEGKNGEWVKGAAVADSGAEEHALPEGEMAFLKTVSSWASKNGKAFR